MPQTRMTPEEKGASLKDLYQSVCMRYIDLFCEKQEMSYEGRVGQGFEIITIGDLNLNFTDIIHDIDTNQPVGKIITWYDECIESHEEGKPWINYQTYCMGYVHEPLLPLNEPKENQLINNQVNMEKNVEAQIIEMPNEIREKI